MAQRNVKLGARKDINGDFRIDKEGYVSDIEIVDWCALVLAESVTCESKTCIQW